MAVFSSLSLYPTLLISLLLTLLLFLSLFAENLRTYSRNLCLDKFVKNYIFFCYYEVTLSRLQSGGSCCLPKVSVFVASCKGSTWPPVLCTDGKRYFTNKHTYKQKYSCVQIPFMGINEIWNLRYGRKII